MCTKQTFDLFYMFSLMAWRPGPKIDVFLQSLIDELKELWHEGILTYDASSNQMFKLHAALFLTINDFPAYGNLSGWSTNWEKACPYCIIHTRSRWLKHGGKYCYKGHRWFLLRDNKFHKNIVSFDGTQESGLAPTEFYETDVRRQLHDVLTEYNKEDLRKMKRDETTGLQVNAIFH